LVFLEGMENVLKGGFFRLDQLILLPEWELESGLTAHKNKVWANFGAVKVRKVNQYHIPEIMGQFICSWQPACKCVLSYPFVFFCSRKAYLAWKMFPQISQLGFAFHYLVKLTMYTTCTFNPSLRLRIQPWFPTGVNLSEGIGHFPRWNRCICLSLEVAIFRWIVLLLNMNLMPWQAAQTLSHLWGLELLMKPLYIYSSWKNYIGFFNDGVRMKKNF